MSPTDVQVRELVRRFATLDMTGWDEAAFDRALAHLGWRPSQVSVEERQQRRRYHAWNCLDHRRDCKEESHEKYDTGLGTGLGEMARHGSEIGSGISVGVGEGEELFRRLRSALEEILGTPSIMRGPGPVLRWRHPVRLLELERVGGYTSLRVSPTDAVEREEFQWWKWGRGRDECELELELFGHWWMLIHPPVLPPPAPEPDPGFYPIPGGVWADDWPEFEKQLADTLHSVVHDFALLDVPDRFIVVVRSPDDFRFVQWTTTEDCALHLQARIPEDSACPGWSEAMAELGWQPSDPRDLEGMMVRDFPTLGWPEATTAARMLVGALQSYGDVAFEDLWYQVISPKVELPGIGLPDSQGERD